MVLAATKNNLRGGVVRTDSPEDRGGCKGVGRLDLKALLFEGVNGELSMGGRLTMIDEQMYAEAINANPQDWDARLVYADWLEERGERWLAVGWRKTVELGKVPELYLSPHTNLSVWWWWENTSPRRHDSCVVDSPWPCAHMGMSFQTPFDALSALAEDLGSREKYMEEVKT